MYNDFQILTYLLFSVVFGLPLMFVTYTGISSVLPINSPYSIVSPLDSMMSTEFPSTVHWVHSGSVTTTLEKGGINSSSITESLVGYDSDSRGSCFILDSSVCFLPLILLHFSPHLQQTCMPLLSPSPKLTHLQSMQQILQLQFFLAKGCLLYTSRCV